MDKRKRKDREFDKGVERMFFFGFIILKDIQV
jgi:hypothetical protein